MIKREKNKKNKRNIEEKRLILKENHTYTHTIAERKKTIFKKQKKCLKNIFYHSKT